MCLISNGNRIESSPVRSVIIRVITKSNDREAGVPYVYHEYDNRLSDKRICNLTKKSAQREVKNISKTLKVRELFENRKNFNF